MLSTVPRKITSCKVPLPVVWEPGGGGGLAILSSSFLCHEEFGIERQLLRNVRKESDGVHLRLYILRTHTYASTSLMWIFIIRFKCMCLTCSYVQDIHINMHIIRKCVITLISKRYTLQVSLCYTVRIPGFTDTGRCACERIFTCSFD